MRAIWLASYPRSGNTLLRTILWHCFGIRSASVYRDDLSGNKELEDMVGHIELDENQRTDFPEKSIQFVKTHEYPIDNNPAIYVIRDGRAASISLSKFDNGDPSLDGLINGQHRFGTWSDHVEAWNPLERKSTLLLKYEEMKDDLPGSLEKICGFLRRDIIKSHIPDRETVSNVEGRWVTRKSNWNADISDELLERFNSLNEKILRKMGYWP